MPRVQVTRRSARTPRAELRGVPFTRKTWDNPIRFKLNRAYGDEFEYDSFAQVSRRWNAKGVTATDFAFPGASAIEFYPAATNGIWEFAPSGDFEAVLEFQSCGTAGGGMSPAIGLLDSNGTGLACSIYSDGNFYGWGISAWAYNATATGPLAHSAGDGRHYWVALRRTGTSVTVRQSIDGVNWGTALAPGTTNVTTNNRLAIFRPYSGSDPGWSILHRFNVYSGPTFFTG